MGKFRGLDTDEGWINRRFASLQRQITEQAAARRLVAQADSAQDLQAVDLAESWADYLAHTFTVPQGFTHALVNLHVTASATLMAGATGSVSVQPVVAGVGGVAFTSQRSNSNSSQYIKVPVSGTFDVWMRALRTGGPWQTTPTILVLSASVVYVRG